MAKLFKFEKEIRDLLLMTQVDEPYGFVYDNPFKEYSFDGILNSKSRYSVEFSFYSFDKNYFLLTFFIGTRSYIALFYEEDYYLVLNLVDKFIRVNSVD